MRNNQNNMMLTIFLIAMISIGWGLAFISLAILLEAMAPIQVLAARWSITALILLVPVLTGRIRIDLRKGRDTAFLLLTGLFEPCAYSILEAYGIKMTSASTSAIFVASIPSMTLILGILFFRNKASLKQAVSLAITFIGVIIATFLSPAFALGGTKAGMICMTFGVIAASMYSLSSRRASEAFDAVSVTAVMAFEGAILFNIIALVQGHGLDTFAIPFSSGVFIGHLLFLSIFCAFGSYFCFNRLLQYVDAALANNIVGSLSTIIGVAAGIIFMGDLWGWYTVAGLAITLVGVWMSTMLMKGKGQ